MSRRLSFVAISFFVLLVLLCVEILYLNATSVRDNKRESVVAFVGLSDLALSNTPYLRHRSLSGVYDVYSMDGSLREYEKETFILEKEMR